MSEFEDRLRDTLARHAAEAPPGQLLAERIVRTVETAPPSRTRSWRTWTFPLIAVGAVGAVVAAVVGIESYHPSASAPAGTHSVVNPAPSRAATSTMSSATTAPAGDTGALRAVRIDDLTFVGPDDGWALASADCIHGTGRCTAFLRTTDGTHWQSMPGPAFNVAGVQGCADPCVAHLRFANDSIGYAYGPSALFMTTDGGLHWKRQQGGALLLETLDENVVRVTTTGSGCPGSCIGQAETAGIGSTTWTTARLGTGLPGFGAQLSRGGSAAYLLLFGHPAGGGSNGKSQLYRSTDDGRHWTAVGEPCPQTSAEVDSYAIAAGAGSRVSVLCANRQAPQRWFVATSSDAGLHWTAQPGIVPVSAADGNELTGDPTTVLVSGGTNALAVSSDGGRSWQLAHGPAGQVTFLGFESAKVGRVVTGSRTIWTTRDGGRAWTPAQLG